MQAQGSWDTGYTKLLSALRHPEPALPLETVLNGIAHYLSELQLATSFAASVISSPLWQLSDRTTLLQIAETFSRAATLRISLLLKNKRGIFQASVSSEFSRWVQSILVGLEGGCPTLQMCIALGLLHGIKANASRVKNIMRLEKDVESILVLAFHGVKRASSVQYWQREFTKDGTPIPGDEIDITLGVIARYQADMSAEALLAAGIKELHPRILHSIGNAFKRGAFLDGATQDYETAGSTLSYSRSSLLWADISEVTGGEAYSDIPVHSKMLARIISDMSDDASNSREIQEVWKMLDEITNFLQSICIQVEESWRSSPLALVDLQFYLDDMELSEHTWAILKNLLFTTLMVNQAVLDALLFLQPIGSSNYKASNITSNIIRTLSALSFVIETFGGVASTGGEGPSFPELKRVFYMAIDITAADAIVCEEIVRVLISELPSQPGVASSEKAKRSFVLSCVEQLVPVLSSGTLESVVVPFCEPHLSNSVHRQTLEASHSVMLSIFAAFADKESGSDNSSRYQGPNNKAQAARSELVFRLVPGYCQYLLENIGEGGLTTPQLRLAYAALVRSTTATSARSSLFEAKGNEDRPGKCSSLTWLCIDQLQQCLESINRAADASMKRRLELTLISLIPNVNLELLPMVLQAVSNAIDTSENEMEREELIKATYDEVLERVGDRERDFVMRWWFELCGKQSNYDEVKGDLGCETDNVPLQSKL